VRVGSSAILFEHFTERARHVVVLAQEEARGLYHGYIGEEHILLGLLREDESLAARVLESLNMTVERVRDEVVLLEGRGTTVDAGMIPFTPRAKKVLRVGAAGGAQPWKGPDWHRAPPPRSPTGG
jgi:ATP-dependent Clp protease ATP-binding subunit ClpC